LAPRTSNAQNVEGMDLTGPEPSSVTSDWFAVDSLDLRGNGRWAVGARLGWSYKPLVIWGGPDGDTELAAVVRHQVSLRPGVAWTLWDRLRLEAQLPFLLANSGNNGQIGTQVIAPERGAALQDLSLGGTVALVGRYGDPARLGAQLKLQLPTGNADAFAGAGTTRMTPALHIAGDIGLLSYGANLAFVGHLTKHRLAGAPVGSQLSFDAAVGLRLLDRKLTVGPELSLSSTVSHGGDGFFEESTTPAELLMGAHYRIGRDWLAGAGVGKGLNQGMTAAEWRSVLSVAWSPEPSAQDSDGDGRADDVDRCPNEAPSGKEDPARPGCSFPDRDGDGIADAADACPDAAAGATADPKQPGCPLPIDSDDDGIADAEDRCPRERAPAELADPARPGCALPDQDTDGVPDDRDLCPTERAAPGQSDPRRLGCPIPQDSDGDGVADPVDACPKEPGSANATDSRRHGCPVVQVTNRELAILEQIQFATGTADIAKESDPLLETVANTLKAHPELELLSIEGHTDNVGPAWLNRQLSAKRAAAVLDRLVTLGIERKRFKSAGFGDARPIAPNDSDTGRAKNRRVEFLIVRRANATSTSTKLQKP
jgi:outer membrane protein OmpA-like peptidoglycan-associated protein